MIVLHSDQQLFSPFILISEDANPRQVHKLGDSAKISGTTISELKERSGTLPKKTGKDRSSDKQTTSVPPYLKSFLNGATAAQKAQIVMIKSVFHEMDIDGDGLLSVSDVNSYFRAVGRESTEVSARKWISARDIDQDGAISLVEFISSFSLQLDPRSKFVANSGIPSDTEKQASVITGAFGALRLGTTTMECKVACEEILSYLQRIVDAPTVSQFWSIHTREEVFHQRVGRHFGGVKLMQAVGFQFEANGTILALRDPQGKEWTTVPADLKKQLLGNIVEISNHLSAVLEPTISNIGAGNVFRFLLYVLNSIIFNSLVSTAIANLGHDTKSLSDWILAIETILKIVNNIINNPTDAKFYNINVTNPNFHQK